MKKHVVQVVTSLFLVGVTTGVVNAAVPVTQNERIEARAQIQQTLNRYIWALDAKDSEMYAAAFTTDGVNRLGTREFKGRDAIRAFIKKNPNEPPLHHLLTNVVMDFLGDGSAHVQSYFLVVQGDIPTGMKISMLGWYDDVFVRVGEQWLIRERKSGTFGPGPEAALAGGAAVEASAVPTGKP